MAAGSTKSSGLDARRNGSRGVLRSSRYELLSRLRHEEEPMQAEFLSIEQLSRHGQSLAIWHHVATRQRRDQLLARLNENERVLDETRLMLGRSAAEGHSIPPAGEWLLDNYYLIQSQIRLARQHLPRRYSMELPQLAGGTSDGLPRVYDIALELISHADGLIDAKNIERFVSAYQSAQHLRIGELWAIPIMLRLALIENLRRVALRIAWQYNDRRLGEHWAARVAEAADESFGRLIHSVAELVDHEPPITSAFVSRFTQSLQGRLPTGNVVTAWLENHLSRQGLTVEQLINADSRSMAADQVSMGNSISSLRALEAFDWSEFVERQSVIERALRHDPLGVYATMSFSSRDTYRHVVERIARRSALSEEQVARLAVEHAQSAAAEATVPVERGGYGNDERLSHVGYYLVDRGRTRLEQSAGYRPSVVDRLARIARTFPLATYVGGIGAVTALLIGAFVWCGVVSDAIPSAGGLALTMLVLLFSLPASQAATSLVNWIVTLLTRPRSIMRIDLENGIAREFRTLVVVPTMLTGRAAVRSLVDQLEVRFLANPDPNLFFALLTDFPDAAEEVRDSDAPLLDFVRAEIDRLNAEHADDRTSIFHLLHRPRKWNASEGVWMGEERKRGKIADLNRLIRTGSADAFSFTAGDIRQLTSARFVITLDTDTQLPSGAAAELVGCLAHPLNRPRIDPATGVVVEGYSILQPRVGTTIPEANQSYFSRLYAGEAGIDPYTKQSSDVYQDLFGQGSFVGKGIYDVHAFETALAGRFPPNRVLSHDLIEGCFVRSGLVNDVELFEGFPSTLLADMSRRHRWIRGDWQIASWLRRRVPTSRGSEPNTLSALSRWKIFDNLRRSLVPIALFAFLTVGWLIAPGLSLLWTLSMLVLLFLPSVVSSLPGLFRKPDEMPWRLHLQAWQRSVRGQLARDAIDFAILPYTVHCNIDAIIRTTYRQSVTHRHLLEWTTASEAEVRTKGGVRDYYEVMAANSLAGVGLTAALSALHPPALVGALPILAAWLIAPLIACRISQKRRSGNVLLDRNETQQLRRLARQTWHYFDTFVNETENWLPPDNVRLHPDETIASRTSPTNIGLGLLANLSAYDFGYLPGSELLERTSHTFATLRRLPRYRGHFYNWYDTRTLAVILPRYVSAVDSGNLWGHMVVLRSGLLEMQNRPVVGPRIREGLEDTLAVLQAINANWSRTAEAGDVRWRDIGGRIERIASECRGDLGRSARHTLGLLMRVEPAAEDLAAAAPHDPLELARWAAALVRQCRAFRQESESLVFWITPLPEAIPAIAESDAQCRTALEAFEALCDRLDTECRLGELPAAAREYGQAIEALAAALSVAGMRSNAPPVAELQSALTALVAAAERAAARASEECRLAQSLADECEDLTSMDFRFLFDPARKLLTIGYNETERKRDTSYYDLLASEARLSSFMAISHGQLPSEHWFALGRVMTAEGGESTLLSWSGSMFEYLMPMIVMPTYEGTLLEQACRAAIQRQIRYGRRRGVPWGISESCYNVTDGQMNFQYRAFGVPGLGLQRGLGENLVVAPYASAMAVMLTPQAACTNLDELERRGYLSEYGFYDAIDFTAGRRLADGRPAPCRTVMAHHSGMSLLAFESALFDRPMQRRFLADSLCKAHDLLLQERVPHAIRPIDPSVIEAGVLPSDEPGEVAASLRVFESPRTAAPEIHLLSNGRYHLSLSNAGGGRSMWNDLAVTRWQADFSCDAYGQFAYLRDLETGEFWSNTYQPTRRDSARHQTVFSQGRVEYRCLHGEVDMKTQIAVSPEDDVEVRRLTVTNLARLARRFELSSYAEVVLAPPAADAAHRAFSGLFVETEWLNDEQTLLCHRRRRSPDEPTLFMFHLLRVHTDGLTAGADETTVPETDRARFLGRLRTPANPVAMAQPTLEAGAVGTVLDPIVSLRRRLSIAPEEGVIIDIVTGVAEDRAKVLTLIEKYHDTRLADRVFELSRSHSQAMLEHLGITEAEAQRYAQLAAALLYPGPHQRVSGSQIVRYLARQDTLWPFGVGGELPIVLGRIGRGGSPKFGEQLIKAHAYWRGKGVRADLVLCLEDEGGYRNELHDRLLGFLISTPSGQWIDQPGGVFVRRTDQYSSDDWQRLEAAATVVVSDAGGTLEEQIARGTPPVTAGAALKTTRAPSASRGTPGRRPTPDLLQFNGTGGFTRDGREYISLVTPEAPPPAPWSNVLANPQFGSVVTESGLGGTWRENAHEWRLTPWSNDPVSDPAGEAVYVRDDETGEYFSPTPLPASGGRGYLCRHGFGYSVWETSALELETELWAYVSVESPAKFLLLTIRNTSGRKRRIGVAAYVEWVLGEHRDKTARHIITEVEPQSGALLGQNRFHVDFQDRVAFLQCSERNRTFTCDRTEFLGRCGSVESPAGLRRASLSGRAGAGSDPAAAILSSFELGEGESREIAIVLGAERATAVRDFVQRVGTVTAARHELHRVWDQWNGLLGTIHAETPQEDLNLLANGWMFYQTLACRLWGRAAFYQSGGAYGFRDQLQDSLAMLHAVPELTREHLLLCASRQFEEGDVQHWWHPPTGRGVRTRISDDMLWLPYVAARYYDHTGDAAVFNEQATFLRDRKLDSSEESSFTLPAVTEETATLYEHCRRAIRRCLKFGRHGLPLIGAGDWNDGFNRIGEEGRGESVWLGFFLIDVLKRFEPIARQRGDEAFADDCLAQVAHLTGNIGQHAWDGAWFLRAFADDGSPIGSAKNEVCRIDSLSQSWAVITRAADSERLREAMTSAYTELVRPEEHVIRLFAPPFDEHSFDAGYIRSYPPGVRENGGQYTHAGIWMAIAFAQMGDAERAWECFDRLCPTRHASSADEIAAYRVEPYVIAADIYSEPPHAGRGGWTWYTGSAGWMYQLIIESLLGVVVNRGRTMQFRPCPRPGWKGYTVHYRFGKSIYHLRFTIAGPPSHHVEQVILDGNPQEDLQIPLRDDGREYEVEVLLGIP